MLYAQLAAVALAAVTLVASGCGGSSKTGATAASTTTATSGRPVTRADAILIAKAGAICKRLRAEGTSLNFSTQRAIAISIPRFASYQQAALGELRKLVPSASLAHEWQRFEVAAHALAGDTVKLGEDAKAYRFAAAKPLAGRIAQDKVTMTTLAKHAAITGCEQLY